jgi:Leucine-rich repeat (LRR) protein
MFKQSKSVSKQPAHIGESHRALWKAARQSGQLNLSNSNLIEVPSWVWRVNVDVPDEGKVATFDASDRWWEQVDLVKLNLSGNAIERLSEDIILLPALTLLDVRNNCLLILPEAIASLVNIQKLYLSHNKLTQVPQSFCCLRNLQELCLDHNMIEELPSIFGQLASLEVVDLSFNRLSSLPSSFGQLTKLSKLNVSNNKLTSLPREIGLLRSLLIFDATHNQLSALPSEIGNIPTLMQLYVRHNNITELPVFKFISKLKELQIGNNYITVFSKQHMESLQNISILDLRDNKIKSISEDVVIMQCLERLDISNNDIVSLPNVLGTMDNLKSLIVDGNPLKSLRREIIARGTMEIKRYLLSRLSEDKLPEMPAGKGVIGGSIDDLDPYKVASSRCLDYSGKKAATLPPTLWEAGVKGAVSVVNLSKNELTVLPEDIRYISESVQELYMAYNRLSNLSVTVGRLHLLRILDVQSNRLTDLPDSLSSLKHLRELIISTNSFKILPKVVYQLPALEVLQANNNQLSNIEASGVQGMTMLAVLNLQNNDISTVPAELGLCSQLRSLLLEGNPLRAPRPAILAKGTPAILDYLRGRIVT